MAKDALPEDRSAVFKIFEESLSDVQRQLLLRNPDILSPELVGQLYHASLERLPARVTEPHLSEGDYVVKDSGETTIKRSRKLVNSWMAFRSYYSPLIRDLPQKTRSPMLAILWKNDSDHGLWELLSAAFSHIRDNHPEDGVAIDQFLATASQVVPVVPADQYFMRRGWIRVGETLERSNVLPQEMPKVCNFSCAGVVRYCYRQGLISRPPVVEQPYWRTLKDVQDCASSISFASVPLAPLSYHGSDTITQGRPERETNAQSEDYRGCDDSVADNHAVDTGISDYSREHISSVARISADETAQVDGNVAKLLLTRRGSEFALSAADTEPRIPQTSETEADHELGIEFLLQDDLYA